jgi:hypothetical protein
LWEKVSPKATDEGDAKRLKVPTAAGSPRKTLIRVEKR